MLSEDADCGISKGLPGDLTTGSGSNGGRLLSVGRNAIHEVLYSPVGVVEGRTHGLLHLRPLEPHVHQHAHVALQVGPR